MPELIGTSVKPDPEIRKRLADELKRLGVTHEQAAKESGIAKATLDNILSGAVTSMKDVHIVALLRAYPSIQMLYVLLGEHYKFDNTYRSTFAKIIDLSKKALDS